MKYMYVILVIFMSGCATLPDSIPIEVQHLSHISQHFGSHQTELGFEAIFVGAKWNRGPVQFEIKDGYSKELYDNKHEIFEASIKYEIRIRK